MSEKKKSRVGIINLGCARNVVDSQSILSQMKAKGHTIVDAKDAEVVILNTCSFIEDARKESIDAALDLLELKKQGKIKKVILAGCLSERYGSQLAKELKGVDAFMGVQDLSHEVAPEPVYLTPRHFAYLKISESCYNQCSFCAIPGIKGRFTSRTIESIVAEAERLEERGIKELNIIGQDITAYGMDVYREKKLAFLLKQIIKHTRSIRWIRLLYAFPAHVTDELIETIAGEERICKYIDLPFQHISDNILKSMNRGITTQKTRDLVKKLYAKIPDGGFRTTFIVGLPGETDEDFEELLEFAKDIRFEKVGVFKYSHEEGTPAYDMPGQVKEAVKEQRFNQLMQIQQKISEDVLKKYLGKSLDVLIEEKKKGEDGIYIGRTEYDAPEVDGLVYVHTDKKLTIGHFVKVRVHETCEYDLAGTYEKHS